MSSSTLNSDATAPAEPRASLRGWQLLCYGLGLIAVFSALLVGLQLGVVHLMQESGNDRSRFVVKLLTDPRRNIVLGDSHVGQRDRMGQDYLFLGRPGTTSFEMRRFAETFFRDKAPGRVVIAAGPQLFADVRQAEWRSLNQESLKYQVLPFPLFVLEPEVAKATAQILRKIPAQILSADKAFGAEASLEANSNGTTKELAIARKQFRALDRVRSRLVSFYDLAPETRAVILRGRYERQLPSLDFRRTPAWDHFRELLAFLKARGAEVCIIRTPIIAEYREMIAVDPEGGRFTEALTAVQDLAAAQGMRFRDFTEIVPGLPSFYFKNQDHLNALGHQVFWPEVDKACFDDPAPERKGGDTRPLYHKLELENAGFETALAGTPTCLPGWAWRGRLRVRRVSRHKEAQVDDSPFRSKASYGVTGSKGAGEPRWWGLGKAFFVEKNGLVTVRVKVLSEDLTLPGKTEGNGNSKTLHFGKDDAFIEVEALNAQGRPIKLAPPIRNSTTLSEQVAARGLTEAEARTGWQNLRHSFVVPGSARSLRIWIIATDGGGTRRKRGWKGGAPALLLDDFELKSQWPLEEIALPEGGREIAGC